jgi:hypothetical protein
MSFTGNGVNTADISGTLELPFYPVIDLAVFADNYSISSDYPAELVKHKAIEVLGEIASELDESRANWQAEGYASLAEVPQIVLDGTGAYEAAFLTSVYSLLKSRLIRLVYASVRGDDQANYKEEMRALQADSRQSLAALKNKTVSMAELL